jgi:3,4-dihydroxy 2-butanone 4-phosphate synthase/GTP cyclohydrolase II
MQDRHPFVSTVEEILDDARNGKMFILVDDEERENEGDLVVPAQMATPDAINFMARHGRGLICLSMTRRRIEQLGLQLMPGTGTQHETAFTISIEARHGVTTGISAQDRARTIAAAIDSANGPEVIATPGHVFPLMARDGGVLVRAGHTEAAVDIARIAGLNPAAVICEIMNDDGTMARMDDLIPFAQFHNLKLGTIRDLIAYRRRHDHLVHCIGHSFFDSDHGGRWTVKVFSNRVDQSELLVLQKGESNPERPTLVRMHHVSPYTDILAESANARTGVLHRAMDIIGEEGAGVIVLLRDTSANFIANMMLKRDPASGGHLRDYGIGAQILAYLGIHRMVLLTNSHQTIVGLEGYGLEVVSQRPI